jgi:hypothetical protein
MTEQSHERSEITHCSVFRDGQAASVFAKNVADSEHAGALTQRASLFRVGASATIVNGAMLEKAMLEKAW